MTALPSELLEPLLADACSIAIHRLLRSTGEDADLDRFVAEIKGIDSVAMANRGYATRWDDPTGVHASVAASNMWGMAMGLREKSRPERDAFLAKLRAAR